MKVVGFAVLIPVKELQRSTYPLKKPKGYFHVKTLLKANNGQYSSESYGTH